MSAEKLREAAELVRGSTQNYTLSVEACTAMLLAADACTTVAAQMESATQGFEEWLAMMREAMPYENFSKGCKSAYLAGQASMETRFIEASRLLLETTHAAQAAMQAKIDEIHVLLDADESAIIRNEKDGYPEGRQDRELALLERVKALCVYAADWKRWHDELQVKLDAANERVKELEHLARFGLTPNGEDAREMCCREYKQELKAALATAERERELLRKEVRRMDQLIANPHSNPTLYGYDAREAHQIIKHERPAEVRALVEGN